VTDFRAQTRRTFANITALLESEGASWKDVVRTTCYLRDIERDYAAFNEERTAFYREQGLDPLPASTGIQAILCRPDLLVEIEAIAMFLIGKKEPRRACRGRHLKLPIAASVISGSSVASGFRFPFSLCGASVVNIVLALLSGAALLHAQPPATCSLRRQIRPVHHQGPGGCTPTPTRPKTCGPTPAIPPRLTTRITARSWWNTTARRAMCPR
jgi:hypothetical protein